MKSTAIKWLLGGEALLCVAGALFLSANIHADSIILSPFSQICRILREMSLSGSAGNAAAWVIYIILGSIPLLTGLLLCIRRKQQLADIMLIPISAFLYFLLYRFINPGLNRVSFSSAAALGLSMEATPVMVQMAISSVFWSLAICWLLLRILHTADRVDSSKLGKYCKVLLIILLAVCILALCGQAVAQLAADIRSRAGNNAAIILTVLLFICNNIAAVLQIALFWQALKFCEVMQEDAFGEAAVNAAGRMAQSSRVMIIGAAIGAALANLLQWLGMSVLGDISVSTTVPLFSIALAIGLLLLSRYIAQSRTLKEDNELFI